jgi:hypothetical protein
MSLDQALESLVVDGYFGERGVAPHVPIATAALLACVPGRVAFQQSFELFRAIGFRPKSSSGGTRDSRAARTRRKPALT